MEDCNIATCLSLQEEFASLEDDFPEEVEGTSFDEDGNDVDDVNSFDAVEEDIAGGTPEANPAKKKRSRRGRYKRINAFLPIIKRDFRRTLPIMWVNVINWNDPNLLRRFFNVVYRDGSEIKNHGLNQVLSIIPLVKDSSTRDLTVLQSAYKCAVSPDSCCRLKGCEIKRFKGVSESQIIMSIQFTGTKLFDLNVSNAMDCLGISHSDSSQPPRVDREIDIKKLRSHCMLSANPIYAVVEGVFIITVHENKFVTKAEFFTSSVTCTTLPSPTTPFP